MARKPRIDVGGEFYHVINRANARMKIFFSESDYKLLEKILLEGKYLFDMRILSYCIMPNHFHLLLWPKNDGDMQKFMRWITLKHTQLWHKIHDTVGTGHLYQGRYKSFLIKDEKHLLTEMIYIERNPVRAKIAEKATGWAFSSAQYRIGTSNYLVSSSPIALPHDYLDFVNDKTKN